MLQILLDKELVKSYLSYRVDWLENWHRLDWERIFFLGEILLEITVITDFMCPSVNRDRLFVLLFFYKGKKLFTHIRAAEHCNHSLPKRPESRNFFYFGR
jgi:hypothetical protein